VRACIHGAISADCAHCEEGRIEQRQQDAKDREIATPEEFARLPRRPRARGFDHNMVAEMRTVLGIDPGRVTGWARFFDGQLIEAGARVDEDVLADPPEIQIGPAAVVIEVPRIYPHGGKGDPNQLLDLAITVGDLRGYYVRRGAEVHLVTPRRWKGTVPKAIHNARVLSALTPEEFARLPRRPRARGFDHNMVDGVGLALWYLDKEGLRQ